MPIVTITSDFGLTDYYAAMLKGAILSKNEQVNIVDISHNVKNYDIVQAAFVLKNAYTSFPEGTIHIISINNFYAKHKSFLAIRENGHYFIGPDNGLFSLLFDQKPESIYELDYIEKSTFPLKEVFANAVGHITSGKPFNEIGLPIEAIEERISIQPIVSKNQIKGSIIHIDNYENVIVNIDRELFERVQNKRKYAISFKRNKPITKIRKQYYDVPVGEPLSLFNSADYLEIAINMGKAASMLGLNMEDTVQIDFL